MWMKKKKSKQSNDVKESNKSKDVTECLNVKVSEEFNDLKKYKEYKEYKEYKQSKDFKGGGEGVCWIFIEPLAEK